MNSHKSAHPKNSELLVLFEDPIVNEVREARHALAAAFDNDLQKIALDLLQRQKKLGSRLRTTPAR